MLDIVVIGHLSRDLIITPETTRESLGGGTAYAMFVPKLGANAGIVSKVGKNFNQEYWNTLKHSGLILTGLHERGEMSTRFVNKYDTFGKRTQKVEALAEKITPLDIPEDYRSTRIIHFSPLSPAEIDIECFRIARSIAEVTSMDVQGYVRSIDEHGDIHSRAWIEADEILGLVDVVKFHDSELKITVDSESEIEAVTAILQKGPRIVLITRDRRGSTIYTKDKQISIPIVDADVEVDATGCGDVYTMSFLWEFQRFADLKRAGLFAATCSSFNAETIGPYNFPSRASIETRMQKYLDK